MRMALTRGTFSTESRRESRSYVAGAGSSQAASRRSGSAPDARTLFVRFLARDLEEVVPAFREIVIGDDGHGFADLALDLWRRR